MCRGAKEKQIVLISGEAVLRVAGAGVNVLTAHGRIFIRVIPTIIFTVTLPGEWLAQGIVALELVVRTGSYNWWKVVHTGCVATFFKVVGIQFNQAG